MFCSVYIYQSYENKKEFLNERLYKNCNKNKWNGIAMCAQFCCVFVFLISLNLCNKSNTTSAENVYFPTWWSKETCGKVRILARLELQRINIRVRLDISILKF